MLFLFLLVSLPLVKWVIKPSYSLFCWRRISNALGSCVISPDVLRWVVGISFLAMAIWLLIPDKLDTMPKPLQRFGVLGATTIMFFIAEMGDKTQIATIALAARYDAMFAVVAGTTLGMMLVNVPVVFLGDLIAKRIPMKLIHGTAALIFAVLGILTLLNVGRFFS